MYKLTKISALLAFITPVTLLATPGVDQLLHDYSSKSSVNADAARGKSLWETAVAVPGTDESRNCMRCHGDSLRTMGKHAKTGKEIKPMSPAVNPERLTDPAKIEKWFMRNCKWTWGRECTADEKASFLLYLTTSKD